MSNIPSAPQREPQRSKHAKAKVMNFTIFDAVKSKKKPIKGKDGKKKKKEKIFSSIIRKGAFKSDTYFENSKPGY